MLMSIDLEGMKTVPTVCEANFMLLLKTNEMLAGESVGGKIELASFRSPKYLRYESLVDHCSQHTLKPKLTRSSDGLEYQIN